LKLSRASTYALQAVEYMAARDPNKVVASHLIAKDRAIPARYLLKILNPLVSAQILRSVKGPNGGYRLARPAAKISLLEILEAIDGPVRGEVPHVSMGENDLDARLNTICSRSAAEVHSRLGKVRLSHLVSTI
jgi:Rrf2 family protein